MNKRSRYHNLKTFSHIIKKKKLKREMLKRTMIRIREHFRMPLSVAANLAACAEIVSCLTNSVNLSIITLQDGELVVPDGS